MHSKQENRLAASNKINNKGDINMFEGHEMVKINKEWLFDIR